MDCWESTPGKSQNCQSGVRTPGQGLGQKACRESQSGSAPPAGRVFVQDPLRSRRKISATGRLRLQTCVKTGAHRKTQQAPDLPKGPKKRKYSLEETQRWQGSPYGPNFSLTAKGPWGRLGKYQDAVFRHTGVTCRLSQAGPGACSPGTLSPRGPFRGASQCPHLIRSSSTGDCEFRQRQQFLPEG